MCLLIATTGRARPSKKALRRAAIQNPDGFGFAVIGDGKIYSYRSMDINDTIKSYCMVRDEFPEGDSIFHLRITTHGDTNIDNCHPFRVNDDVVMGHNGMLPIKEEDGKSDTRIFAEDWLPEFDLGELLDTDEGMSELSQFAGGSKLAFLNTSSLLKQSLYIVNESLGHWADGVWYSNNSYKKSYGYTYNNFSKYTSYASYSKYSSYSTPKEIDLEHDDVWSYRSVHDGDMAWDEEFGCWVPSTEEADHSLVSWICSTCKHEEIYDLDIDQAEMCPECGHCWYCEKSFAECFCNTYNQDEF
jgi:glutamine amidotransferase